MAERSIVDVGRFLQKYGWNVGENPAFGSGRVGGHAPGSYHYGGQAIDVTIPHGQDVAPAFPGGKPLPWKQRTGELSWRAKQLGLFTEALGPGDKGHDTHVHLALAGKNPITEQQLEWLATGRTKDPQGKLTDVMPGAVATAPTSEQQPQAGTVTYNIYVPQKAEEKEVTPQEHLSSFVKKYQEDRGSRALSPTSMYAALAQAATSPDTSLFGLG
jgi:hypothetical protein